MKQSRHSNVICVHPGFFVVIALSLLILPWKWVLAWVVASSCHEAFHYLAIRLCKSAIWRIEIGPAGTIMVTEEMSTINEVCCALAGPLGSLLLIFAAKWLPRVAVCGFLQFLTNMLPIFPVDGGRALCGLIRIFFPASIASRVSSHLSNIVLLIISIVSISASTCFSLGLSPLIATGLLLWKVKIPCKQKPLRVQ